MNTREEYLKLIEETTKHFENVEFECFGVDWWPLIKIELGYYLHQLVNGRPSVNNADTSLTFPIKPIGKGLWLSLLRYKVLPKKKLNVGVFTHSINETEINGKKVNIYTTPFLNKFDKLGINYQLEDFQNRNPSLNVGLLKYYFERVTIKSFNKNAHFQNNLLQIQQYLQNKLNSSFNFYRLFSSTIINSQSFYSAYSFYLNKFCYKKILLYCYYSSETMALIRAAKALSIATIEYQHSSISEHHFAYGGWTNRISKSSSFFPTTIWAWNKKDVDTLNKSFASLPNYKTIIGGNLFLQSIKKQKKTEIKSVLITLQGIPLPSFIMHFMNQKNEYKWYIRQHPRYPLDLDTTNRLQALNPDKIDFKEANKLSLYDLLNKVNYHLTCYSGTAIEALEFGVQNIIFGESGYNSYKEYIEEGTFKYVKNETDIETILSSKKESNQVINSFNIEKRIKEVFA